MTDFFFITTILRTSFWTTFYCASCYYYYTSTEFLKNVLFVLLLLLEFNYFFLTTFSYYYYFDWLFNYSLFPGLGKFFLEQLFYNTTTGRQTDFLTTLQLHYHYWTLKEFEWILQLHLNLIALLLLDLDRF